MDGVNSEELKINLSQKALKDIGDSWIFASEAFRSGNIKNWFKNLKSITLNTQFLFKDDEILELNRIEKKINKYLENIKPTGIQYPEKNKNINNAIDMASVKHIEEYNNKLKKFLYEAGFLFLTKKDVNPEEEM